MAWPEHGNQLPRPIWESTIIDFLNSIRTGQFEGRYLIEVGKAAIKDMLQSGLLGSLLELHDYCEQHDLPFQIAAVPVNRLPAEELQYRASVDPVTGVLQPFYLDICIGFSSQHIAGQLADIGLTPEARRNALHYDTGFLEYIDYDDPDYDVQ